MITTSSLLQRAALTLALACGSASASQIFHVDLNTTALSGSGFLDFAVNGRTGAPLASATVSNLSGAFGAEAERGGAVDGSIPAGFTLTSSAGDNWLTQAVTFGGMFGFDISIGGDFETVAGSDGATFAVGLFDALMGQYAVAARFATLPGLDGLPASLATSADPALATLAEAQADVPEPAAPALFLAALLSAGLVLRRRQAGWR